MKFLPSLIPRFWTSFSVQRSSRKPRAAAWLSDNHVSGSVQAPFTSWDMVAAICASARLPIPVAELCEQLRIKKGIRARPLFGYAGDLLDRIASAYEDVEWWIADDGLHMAIAERHSMLDSLGKFDRAAAELVRAHWKAPAESNTESEDPSRVKTRLSQTSLVEIAKELDRHRFKTAIELQPAQLDALKKHNDQVMASKGVRTFEGLAKHPSLQRHLRRRLYLARDRYETAAGTRAERPFYKIPSIYGSHGYE